MSSPVELSSRYVRLDGIAGGQGGDKLSSKLRHTVRECTHNDPSTGDSDVQMFAMEHMERRL